MNPQNPQELGVQSVSDFHYFEFLPLTRLTAEILKYYIIYYNLTYSMIINSLSDESQVILNLNAGDNLIALFT